MEGTYWFRRVGACSTGPCSHRIIWLNNWPPHKIARWVRRTRDCSIHASICTRIFSSLTIWRARVLILQGWWSKASRLYWISLLEPLRILKIMEVCLKISSEIFQDVIIGYTKLWIFMCTRWVRGGQNINKASRRVSLMLNGWQKASWKLIVILSILKRVVRSACKLLCWHPMVCQVWVIMIDGIWNVDVIKLIRQITTGITV